jgi:hypothetical protein
MSLPGYDTTCEICMYAKTHGSWPPTHKGTHCDCHRSWSGFKEAHCAECHQHFSTDTLAERHRIGSRCMSPLELQRLRTDSGKPVFRVTESKNGTIWRNAQTLYVKPAFLVDG